MVGRIRRDDGSGDNPAREGTALADPTWHGEARGRRIRPPLRAPRKRIWLRWCVSGVDAGGSTADPVTGRLRATAEVAADRAVSPRPTHTAATSAAASSNTEGHGGAAANTSMALRR
ncbi:Os08g0350950 [Oryza sativa Japonica Group]|uniref:Os08g0350950 protein n=1 Tax=Oryza sativa subsp. japonica TaxID=39947 RepID=A0A0P0XF25_ORYSJ|nr:Os08g0350950 [Oryza sativa Japonica Group]